MKFRLRNMLIVISVFAALLASIGYINMTMIPENRRISTELCQQLGEQFENTGTYPNGPYLKFDDLKPLPEISLQETSNGTVANRWGQEIQITPAKSGGVTDKETLEVTVFLGGPVAACSASAVFEYDGNN